MGLAAVTRNALAGMALTISTMATAAPHSAADRAWIAKCIGDRKGERIRGRALMKYCVCMQDVVENNESFSVTGLEHAYPPAHASCVDHSNH